jgi:hypothetical protein
MIVRVLFKWLIISMIVLVLFLALLLGLGYLLKDNEEVTHQLIIKSEHDAQLKQNKEVRRQALFKIKSTPILPQKLTSFEQSQQKIITENVSCESSKECFLVHTNSKMLGCIVAVNATGVAILLKTVSEEGLTKISTNDCQQNYLQESVLISSCKNNTCLYTHE